MEEGMSSTIQPSAENIFEDEDWEDQADKLYEWTQNLSLDDLGVTSPQHLWVIKKQSWTGWDH